jgi:hypothetical protein
MALEVRGGGECFHNPFALEEERKLVVDAPVKESTDVRRRGVEKTV